MADDNFLSDALGAVTGGGNMQDIESKLESEGIQEGEQLFQQKTGIDVSSFLGGGSQTQSQDNSQSDDSSDDSSNDSSNDSSDDDSSN